MQRSLVSEQAVLEILCRHAKLTRDEDLCAGGLGCLRDGHLCVDRDRGDRGDDDVCAAERGRERGYVGIFSGSGAHAARRARLVFLLVLGGLGKWVETLLADWGKRAGPTYWTRHDGNFLHGACGFLLEQLFDDEAADVTRAHDCEFLEARDVCECDRWIIVLVPKAGWPLVVMDTLAPITSERNAAKSVGGSRSTQFGLRLRTWVGDWLEGAPGWTERRRRFEMGRGDMRTVDANKVRPVKVLHMRR